MSADAYVGGSWMTILAGGLNGGGQAYYALDITDPAGFVETSAAALDIVLWEFTDEDDADLGYTYNQPLINYGAMQSAQIAKTNDGKWSLIVGNGYNNTQADGHGSATGHAALFVLDIEAGMDGSWDAADYTKIDTGAGSVATPNGLATPTPVDIDGDGDIDIAYAGDLAGNIWKFDLTDSTASSWSVDLLYAAVDSSGNPQPVTTALMVLPHPNGGHMVSFGTGQYLEVADLSTTDEQSLYGLWDAALNGSASTITGGRANLVEQSVLATIRVSNTDLRITSDHAVDYGTKRGWYMDLPTSGERVGYNPIVRDRRFVFVTLIPDVDPCAAGGSGWIMELDYLSGSRLAQSPFDVNGDLAISAMDLVDYTEDGNTTKVPASGIALDIGIPATPTVIGRDERAEFKVISGSSGDMATLLEGKSIAGGRLSWKQIIDDSE
jgi:type IV pilus assembly protein PilY1